jgi:hypothetical protein
MHNRFIPAEVDPITRNSTFYECRNCLTKRDGTPGIDPDVFFNFPPANLTYASRVLLGFGGLDTIADNFTISIYKQHPFWAVVIDLLDGISAPDYLPFGRDQWYLNMSEDWELTAANALARLPSMITIGAEQFLSRIPREEGATEKHYVVTTLEVKWGRAVATLIALTAGQVLTIVIVWCASRRVLLRDHDSFLAVARLLRTAVNMSEGVVPASSVASGKALAESIQKSAAPPGTIRYGTRRVKSKYEVDIWDDVDNEFPSPRKGTYS